MSCWFHIPRRKFALPRNFSARSAPKCRNTARLTPACLTRAQGTSLVRLVAAMSTSLTAIVLGAAGDPTSIGRGLQDFRQGRFAEALQDWRQGADQGEAKGALYVGVLYDSGLGVTQDYGQAMAWYKRAASAGSAAGAFNVGVLYDSGLGVAKDAKQAASWYGRAASRGFARAAYNLAMMYETGDGVKRSRPRAVAFYERAAEQGISAARAHLVALGQPFAGAVQAPRDTAMQDFQRAQQLLLTRGPAEAANMAALFKNAAQRGNSLAEYDLAYCFEHGMGVPRDTAQALAWYQRAARDASDPAVRSLATAGAGALATRQGPVND